MRLLMMGTGTFAEPTFQALLGSQHDVVGLVTNPDRPSGREREMVRRIKAMAVERGVPVAQPESVNSPEGIAAVSALGPDLLVVAAFGQILSADVLNAARNGGINVHASLLPKYRGAAPIAWAIWNGETHTGVTIIRMSTKLDAGDMLAQEAVEILPEETEGELESRLAPLGARLALAVIGQIASGTSNGVKQDPGQVTKAPKLKKEHGLIDWSQPAARVCCQIRAVQPWPTAYTFWHRPDHQPLRLIVTQAAAIPGRNDCPAGTVAAVTNETLAIAAGSGAVSLRKLQPAGKRVMDAAEFLRGHRVQLGERLGGENL
jgi:methionyl-tRNA formyltransferase